MQSGGREKCKFFFLFSFLNGFATRYADEETTAVTSNVHTVVGVRHKSEPLAEVADCHSSDKNIHFYVKKK